MAAFGGVDMSGIADGVLNQLSAVGAVAIAYIMVVWTLKAFGHIKEILGGGGVTSAEVDDYIAQQHEQAVADGFYDFGGASSAEVRSAESDFADTVRTGGDHQAEWAAEARAAGYTVNDGDIVDRWVDDDTGEVEFSIIRADEILDSPEKLAAWEAQTAEDDRIEAEYRAMWNDPAMADEYAPNRA